MTYKALNEKQETRAAAIVARYDVREYSIVRKSGRVQMVTVNSYGKTRTYTI